MTGPCVACALCAITIEFTGSYCSIDKKKTESDNVCRHKPSKFKRIKTESQPYIILKEMEKE